MTNPSLPLESDVCILGAGPHGLAAAHHLRTASSSLRIVVIDPSGQWLTAWHRQFAMAEIPVLRSPIVHHPAHDPSALAHFLNRTGMSRSDLPYDLPTTCGFAAFCEELVCAGDLPEPLPLHVTTIRRSGSGLELETPQGRLRTQHLIVATNPHRRVVPKWTWPLLGRRAGLVSYGLDVDLRRVGPLDGERVLVVGGGMTAAHLACGAHARGASVHRLTRRPIRVANFDTEPGWLGPKYLQAFDAERDASRRLEIARAARDGGSIPPWMHDQLRSLESGGRLTTHEAGVVGRAEVDAHGTCTVELDGDSLEVDKIWIATGTECDIGALQCLHPIAADAPQERGQPLVDSTLRLGPHPAYVMGRLATAALGPAAGNVWGAQRAAHRITEQLTGVNLRGDSIAAIPRPSTARDVR